MTNKDIIETLVNELNSHTRLYEEGHPTISDREWDKLYFKLAALEEQTGIVMENSPTHKINSYAITGQKKIKHSVPMLSLNKTKDKEEFFLYGGGSEFLISLKMDGLSLRITYEDGKLVRAETRGDGIEGNDVTYLMPAFTNVPMSIDFKEKYEIDGECIITYNDFYRIKGDYKNPRNLAAGSLSLLDPKEAAARKLQFVAWRVITDTGDYMSDRLSGATHLGFTVVPYLINIDEDIDAVIEVMKAKAEKFSYPIDGLVGTFDNVADGLAMGETAHHPKHSLAFKFYDELYPTRLRTIHWSMSRNGTLTPVAVFNPIDIDGTIVERASLHNVSVMRELLGDCAYVGEPLKIYKANQIIPQVAEAGPKYDYGYVVSHCGVSANDQPEHCPCCGGDVYYEENDGVIVAKCGNEKCEGKLINRLDHFCGKHGLDIKGLSKATLEKLIDRGWIEELSDIFTLAEHADEWKSMAGFGDKSVTNILRAIEESKHTSLWQALSAVGIPFVGKTVTKLLTREYKTYDDFREVVRNGSFIHLDGIGEVINEELKKFDYAELDYIVDNYLTIEEEKEIETDISLLEGITFCITGKVHKWSKRDDLKNYIESCGGKVVGSMSSKVEYLINNDSTSQTAKNKAAIAAGIPILTEEDFIEKFGSDL